MAYSRYATHYSGFNAIPLYMYMYVHRCIRSFAKMSMCNCVMSKIVAGGHRIGGHIEMWVVFRIRTRLLLMLVHTLAIETQRLIFELVRKRFEWVLSSIMSCWTVFLSSDFFFSMDGVLFFFPFELSIITMMDGI